MSMEQDFCFESYTKRVRNEVRFGATDWIMLLGAFICAGGYAFLHPSIFFTGNPLLPGLGLTLSTWLMLLLCMGYIGWRKLRWNLQSIFLLISSLLLSATYGIFSNNTLRLMNLPVLGVLCILTVYSLKGGFPELSSKGFTGSIFHAASSIGKNFPLPAFALKNQFKSGENLHIKELLLGLGICIPVIGLILLLLCDADSIFGGLVSGLFKGLYPPNAGSTIWNLLRLLMLALMLFGFVYGLNRKFVPREKGLERIVFPKVTAATVLTAMSIVYAVFVYVQCRYLFLGSEAILAEGGYAVYARSGFFQLVAVAFITMLIVLPILIKLPDSRLMRCLGAFVTLMTMVIVFSAFWRMRLYILEFGLTLLRLVTLWGILAITAAMIATLFNAANPRLRIFRVLFVFTICSWLIFNYTNISQRIVDYNITAYRSGKLETIDVQYLRRLGPEAVPALDFLRKENRLGVEEMGEVIQYRAEILKEKPVFYDWSLSWLNYK